MLLVSKNAFLLKKSYVTMCNYVKTFHCNSTYNVVYKVFTQISYCRKQIFVMAFLSANSMKLKQAWCHVSWWKVILALWPFMWHTRNTWFFCIVQSNILLMRIRVSAIGHVVYFRRYVSSGTWFSFGFTSKNEMKWKKKKKWWTKKL